MNSMAIIIRRAKVTILISVLLFLGINAIAYMILILWGQIEPERIYLDGGVLDISIGMNKTQALQVLTNNPKVNRLKGHENGLNVSSPEDLRSLSNLGYSVLIASNERGLPLTLFDLKNSSPLEIVPGAQREDISRLFGSSTEGAFIENLEEYWRLNPGMKMQAWLNLQDSSLYSDALSGDQLELQLLRTDLWYFNYPIFLGLRNMHVWVYFLEDRISSIRTSYVLVGI